MSNELIIEDCCWNLEAYRRLIDEGLSIDDFVSDGLAEGKYRQFSDADRVELLKTVFNMIKGTRQ